MPVALMAKPLRYSKLAIIAVPGSLYSKLDKTIRDGLCNGPAVQLWWSWLRPTCYALGDINMERVGIRDAAWLSGWMSHCDRTTGYYMLRFLNAHYEEWIEGVSRPDENQADEYAQERCEDCDVYENCDDHCDSYWESHDTYIEEHTDYNIDYMENAWEDWCDEERTPLEAPGVSLLTPETIGVYEPIEYMRENCCWDKPYELILPVTDEHLDRVVNATGYYQNIHVMNLWCRMRVAHTEGGSSRWGTIEGAVAVLRLDRHQDYMRKAGFPCEVDDDNAA